MLNAPTPNLQQAIVATDLAFSIDRGVEYLASALGSEAGERFRQCAAVMFPGRESLMLDEAGATALCWLTDHPNIDQALALFAGMRLSRVSMVGTDGTFTLDPDAAAREPRLQPLLAPTPAIAAGLLIRFGAQPDPGCAAQGLMIREDQGGASGVDVDLLVDGVSVRLSYGASIDSAIIVSWRGVIGQAAAALGEAACQPSAKAAEVGAVGPMLKGA